MGAAAALAAAAVLTGVPRLSSAQTAASWSTFHGNAARSGYTTQSGPATSVVANQWTLPRAIVGSAAVDAGGTAYIGDTDGKVYAFNSSNPAGPIWTFATGARVIDTPSLSPDGKTVYVGSDDGYLYALDASKGTKIWSQSVGGAVEGSPLVSSDGGTIYVSNVNGTIYALKSTDGSVVWHTVINGAIPGSMALSADGTSLYVATSTDYMYAVATGGATPGQATKPYYLDGPAHGSPAVDPNGNIYVTTGTGSLMAFSPGSSTATWTFQLPTPASTNTTPAITNGLVVFGDGDGTFYGINPSNGQVIWTQRSVNTTNSSAAIAGGNSTIYVGSDNGSIWALNTSGATDWVKATGAPVVSSPAIGPDGSVWVGSENRILYRFHDITVPPPPSTPVPGATAVPTATASPTPVTTPTVVPLSFTIKAKVKEGTKQFLTVHSNPNTPIHMEVIFPNGMHWWHTGKTGPKGIMKYQWWQGSSKFTHNRYRAKVIVYTTGATTVTKTYQLLLGHIDVSVEPRTVRPNQVFNLWIHSTGYTPTITRLVSPNGHQRRIAVRTNRHGWAHLRIHVTSWLLRGGKATHIDVFSETHGKRRPGYATRLFFVLKK